MPSCPPKLHDLTDALLARSDALTPAEHEHLVLSAVMARLAQKQPAQARDVLLRERQRRPAADFTDQPWLRYLGQTLH